MADDFTLKGKVDLDTSGLTTGIAGAAIKFDALMMAGKMAMQEIELAYNRTIGKMLEFGDQMSDQAMILGDTTENIQRLRNASIAVGTDFDSAATAVKMFSQRVGDSGQAGEDLRNKISNLGVSLNNSDGSARSMISVFMDLNTKMGMMSDTAARNGLAMDLYGRSWSSVADMIGSADQSLTAFKDNGGIISDADLRKAEELKNQMGVLNEKFEAMGRTVGQEMMPAMQLLIDSLNSMPSLGEGTKQALEVIDDALKAVIFTITMAVFGMRELDALFRRDFSLAETIRNETAAYIENAKNPVGSPGTSKPSSAPWTGNPTTPGSTGAYDSGGASGSGGSGGGMGTKMLVLSPSDLARGVDQWNALVDANGNVVRDNMGNAMVDYSKSQGGSGMSNDRGMSGQYADKYSRVNDILSGSYDQGNVYGQQLTALAARARSASGGLGPGDSWMNTGENESIANATLAAAAGYNRTTNIYVNVPEGTPADMADRVAQAISRALAQRVVT